jgi:hypothetical protein
MFADNRKSNLTLLFQPTAFGRGGSARSTKEKEKT